MDVPPDMPFRQHALHVAPPVASRPAKALLEELGVVFERGAQLGLLAILDVGPPAVGDHPSSNEVVVVTIELIPPEQPVFVSEAIGEGRVLQDHGPIARGPTRQTGDATINVSSGRNFKVASFEVESAQEAPDAGP
jgi:hypothetical protein